MSNNNANAAAGLMALRAAPNANVRAGAANLMALRAGPNANVRAGAANLMALRAAPNANAAAGLMALGRPKMVRGLGQRRLLSGIPAGIANNPDGGPGAADFSMAPQMASTAKGLGAMSHRRMSWAPTQTRKRKQKQDGGASVLPQWTNHGYMKQVQREMHGKANAASRKKERERGAVATQLDPLNFNVEAGQGPTSMLNGGYRRVRKSVRRRRY